MFPDITNPPAVTGDVVDVSVIASLYCPAAAVTTVIVGMTKLAVSFFGAFIRTVNGFKALVTDPVKLKNANKGAGNAWTTAFVPVSYQPLPVTVPPVAGLTAVVMKYWVRNSA